MLVLIKDMEKIYILKLENDKFYVGKTINIEAKYKEHLNGTSSPWTKKYRPVSIMDKHLSTSYLDEDKYVIEYMSKYGIENVRGGSYSSMELDDLSLIILRKEVHTRYSTNLHFTKECCQTIKEIEDNNSDDSCSSSSSYEYIVWYCEFCNKEFETKNSAIKHEDSCYKKTISYMI